MIKSLSIQNFQSHEKTRLSFHPGVNVIVGSSDSGKTALIRALRWVCWNRPTGDSIRSDWGGDTLVLVETEEGAVLRFKGKEDRYELKAGDKRSTIFKAFGANVPEEISAFLNVNEINLQSQLDAPFLLSESPGVIAAHFNKIARLDQIDIATSKLNGMLRELSTRLTHKEEEEERLQAQLAQFEDLDKLETEIEVLEDLQKRLQNMQSASRQLSALIKSLEAIEQKLPKELDILALDSLVQGLSKLTEQEDALQAAVEKIEMLDTDIQGLTSLPAMEELVEDTLSKKKELRELSSAHEKGRKMVRELGEVENEIEYLEQLVTKKQKTFDREMPDVCPLCEQPIKH